LLNDIPQPFQKFWNLLHDHKNIFLKVFGY
jgi:hypothetical protein